MRERLKFEQRNAQQSATIPEVMDEYEAFGYVRVCSKTLRKLRKVSKIPYPKVGDGSYTFDLNSTNGF